MVEPFLNFIRLYQTSQYSLIQLLKEVGARSTTFSDTGLTATTNYSYQVSAIDNATNESLKSTAQTIKTAQVPATTWENGAKQSFATYCKRSHDQGGRAPNLKDYSAPFPYGSKVLGKVLNNHKNTCSASEKTLIQSWSDGGILFK